MATAMEKLDAGRFLAARRHKYWTASLFQLRLVERSGIGTLCVTNDARVMFDPAFIDMPENDIAVCGIMIAHENGHIILDHEGRRCGRDPQLWNKACDYELNSILVAAGWKMPEHGLYPDRDGLPNGMNAEKYYDLLNQQQEQEEQQPSEQQNGSGDEHGDGQQGSDADEDGDNEQENSGAGENDDADEDGEQEQGDEGNDDADEDGEGKDDEGGSGNQQPELKDNIFNDEPKCGGGAGNPHEFEAEPTAEKGLSDLQKSILRTQAAHEIEAEVASGRGNVPAQLVDWAKAQLAPPRIRWQEKLAARVRRVVNVVVGQRDNTYSKMSRRFAVLHQLTGGRAPVMPAKCGPAVDAIGIIDGSGSMGDRVRLANGETMNRCDAAASEVAGIFNSIGRPIEFCVYDTHARARVTVKSSADASKLAQAGGGTSMASAVREIVNRKGGKPYNICLLITDGETDWPTREEARRVNLVTVIINDRLNRESVPDYVDPIYVD